MKRPCSRTLDKPILLFGLELEDIAVWSLAVGLGSLLIGPMIPGILGFVGWFGLLYFKKDKPQGHMLHFLYSKGFQLPGLIYPICMVNRYGIYGHNTIKRFHLS